MYESSSLAVSLEEILFFPLLGGGEVVEDGSEVWDASAVCNGAFEIPPAFTAVPLIHPLTVPSARCVPVAPCGAIFFFFVTGFSAAFRMLCSIKSSSDSGTILRLFGS